MQRRDEDRARPNVVNGFDRVARLAQCPTGAFAEILQLELIGRDEIGGRDGLAPQGFRNTFVYKDAAADIAYHRITAISRRRVGPLDGCDSLETSGAAIVRT